MYEDNFYKLPLEEMSAASTTNMADKLRARFDASRENMINLSKNPTSVSDYNSKLKSHQKLGRVYHKLKDYSSDKRYKEKHPISHKIKSAVSSLKKYLGLNEFSMSTYEHLANKIMDRSHNASVTANNYKADLKKRLADHYNKKAARLFNVANDIENHMISNKHLFNK